MVSLKTSIVIFAIQDVSLVRVMSMLPGPDRRRDPRRTQSAAGLPLGPHHPGVEKRERTAAEQAHNREIEQARKQKEKEALQRNIQKKYHQQEKEKFQAAILQQKEGNEEKTVSQRWKEIKAAEGSYRLAKHILKGVAKAIVPESLPAGKPSGLKPEGKKVELLEDILDESSEGGPDQHLEVTKEILEAWKSQWMWDRGQVKWYQLPTTERFLTRIYVGAKTFTELVETFFSNRDKDLEAHAATGESLADYYNWRYLPTSNILDTIGACSETTCPETARTIFGEVYETVQRWCRRDTRKEKAYCIALIKDMERRKEDLAPKLAEKLGLAAGNLFNLESKSKESESEESELEESDLEESEPEESESEETSSPQRRPDIDLSSGKGPLRPSTGSAAGAISHGNNVTDPADSGYRPRGLGAAFRSLLAKRPQKLRLPKFSSKSKPDR